MARKTNCLKNGKYAYFRKTKTIGYDINGKAIKKEFYGKGENDAKQKVDKYTKRLDAGLEVGNEKQTIEQLMNYWLFNVLIYSRDVKSASFEAHETNYRLYIKNSDIGLLPVYTITSTAIQEFYNSLFKNGKTSSKIFDINKSLRSFFTYCIKKKIISDNPCSLNIIEIPGNGDGEEDEEEEEEKIIVFNDNELKTLVSSLDYDENKNNTLNVSIQLALITGIRKGELLGLKRKFVNLDKCEIKIRNTLKSVKEFEIGTDDSNKYKRVLKLKPPKSKSSKRTIPFPKEFRLILSNYIKEEEKKYSDLGLKFNEDSLMFTTETCSPIDSRNYLRSWERFLKRINIEYRKFHALRDTYATSLVRRGAKIFEVKELLGHSSIKITEKYYIYCFPEDKSETVKLISDFINS